MRLTSDTKEKILLSVFDRLLLGGVIGLCAFFATRWLDDRRSDLARQEATVASDLAVRQAVATAKVAALQDIASVVASALTAADDVGGSFQAHFAECHESGCAERMTGALAKRVNDLEAAAHSARVAQSRAALFVDTETEASLIANGTALLGVELAALSHDPRALAEAVDEAHRAGDAAMAHLRQQVPDSNQWKEGVSRHDLQHADVAAVESTVPSPSR